VHIVSPSRAEGGPGVTRGRRIHAGFSFPESRVGVAEPRHFRRLLPVCCLGASAMSAERPTPAGPVRRLHEPRRRHGHTRNRRFTTLGAWAIAVLVSVLSLYLLASFVPL
jgi:hypothetical protein